MTSTPTWRITIQAIVTSRELGVAQGGAVHPEQQAEQHQPSAEPQRGPVLGPRLGGQGAGQVEARQDQRGPEEQDRGGHPSRDRQEGYGRRDTGREGKRQQVHASTVADRA